MNRKLTGPYIILSLAFCFLVGSLKCILASNHDNSSQSSPVGVTDPNATVSKASLGFNGLPPLSVVYVDPAFNGTNLRRVTNRTASNSFAAHIYSQLQAFSLDNEYMLLLEDEDYVIRRVSDLSLVNMNLPSINNPRWQPALTHTLVFYDSDEDTTLRVQYGNVDTGTLQTVYTFPSNYQRIQNNQSFDELSEDGRWMAGMAEMANGDLGIFAVNLLSNPITLGAQISLDALYDGPCQEDPVWGRIEPDWIGVSPLGNYLVIQWARDGTDRCSGLEAYNIQTGQYVGHIYDSHQHGDLAVKSNGQECFVTTRTDTPNLAIYDLPNGVNSPTVILDLPWGGVSHISCQGPHGLCVVSSYDNLEVAGGPFDNEIYLVFFDGSVRRLTHHRSSECGYWVQARASISDNGLFIIFDSDYQRETGGPNSCSKLGYLGGGEVYLIQLSPADLVSPGAPSPDDDGDGLSNDEESQYGTNPNDPDSDDDSYLDGQEVGAGTNPLSATSYPAVIKITGDNSYVLYVNGVQIGSDGNWGNVETYYVNLQPGGTVAIQANDAGWIAGLACQIRYGSQYQYSNFLWQVSTSAGSNWQSSSYDHSTWVSAVEHYAMGQGPWGTAVSSSFDAGVKWIWTSDAVNHNVAYFFTKFDPSQNAMVKFSIDNLGELYKNGTQVASINDWSNPKFIPMSLVPGDVLFFHLQDQGWIAGAIAQITWLDSSGNKQTLGTDSTWRYTTSYVPGSENPGFDDSSWSFTSEIASLGDPPWGTTGNLNYISGAQWIWASNAYDINEIWVRKLIPNATLSMTADNAFEVYHNGVLVGSSSDWSNVQKIGLNLQTNDVIAVKAWDLGWIAGFLASINYNGTTLVTNPTWKFSKGPFTDLSRTQTSYVDTSWSNASARGSNGIWPWGSISSIDPSAQWIWAPDFENDDTVYFRFKIGTSNNASGFTTLQLTADNELEFYLNGNLLITNNYWPVPKFISLQLASGDVLAVKATDSGYKAGLLLNATGAYNIVSDTSWKMSTVEQAGWNTQGFNDSAWANATGYGAYGASPWGTGVTGFPNPSSAQWIWSNQNETGTNNIDPAVYFRKATQ